MSGKSNTTTIVTFRLKNETIQKIKVAINSPKSPALSVNDYCRRVIERWAYRHEIRKNTD
jgi:hypothetical protein